MTKITLLKSMLLFFIVFWSVNTLGQGVFTSAATGNWNASGSWTFTGTDADGIPDADDNVTIGSAHTITIDANSACSNITLNGATTGTRLAIGNFTLEVGGTLNGDATGLSTTLITSGTGRLKFIGNSRALFGSNWGGNPPSWRFEVALTAGQTGTASTNVKAGDIIITSGTFDLGTNELRPDNNVANTGSLTIETGAVLKCLRLSRTGTANTPFGSMTMNGTAKFQPNSSTASTTNYLPAVSGGFPVYTFSTASTIEYVGSSSGTISVVPYQNLAVTLANSGGSRSIAAALTIAGNLTVGTATVSNNIAGTTVGGNITINSDGVLTAGSASATITGSGASNALIVNNNGFLTIVSRSTAASPPAAGSTTPFSTQYPGLETITLNSGSTVEYRVPGGTGMGTQDIQKTYGGSTISYQNLTLSLITGTTAQNATQYIPDGLSIAGKLKITTNCTLTNTQDVIFNNSSPLTVGSLEISRTGATSTAVVQNIKLADQTYNVTGATTLQNSGILFQSNSTVINFNGAVTTSGALTDQAILRFNNFSPTVNFNHNLADGASATTFSVAGTEVPVINFNNGTSGSPLTTTAANLRGAVTVNGYRTASGSFRTSNATASAYSMNIVGTLNLGASTSVATNTGGGTNILSGSGTIKLTGDYGAQVSGYSANNFHGTGTLHLAGSTQQTIPTGTYENVIVENATGGVILGGNITVSNSLTLTAGTLATGANTLTLNGTTSGTGFINTGASGTLTYNGTSTQTLSAANLTSGSVNNLVVNAGSKLTTSGTIAATSLTLNSSASGTATLVDNGALTATTANVKQYLPIYRSWYMTSPMTGISTIPVDNNSATPTLIKYYDETLGDPAGWSTATGMKGGTGYILNPGTTSGASTLTFTGTLNNGNVTVDVSRSNVTKAGFNLVGNPYPSHIVWTTDMATSANLLPSIWYRTAVFDIDHNVYSFETYNAAGTIAVPEGATPYIPPMQGFWVRVDDTHSSGQLTFTNAMRYHKDSNPLKAPLSKNFENQIIRLQLRGGNVTDEAVVYFNNKASNDFDIFDSQKMLNGPTSSIPDIYTMAGSENLVINGMKDLPYDTEIPLCFKANASGLQSFTIKANEISNFETGTQLYIKNNFTGESQQITNDTEYVFSPSAVGYNPAFSLIIKAPGTTTGFSGNNFKNNQIYVSANRHIIVNSISTEKNSVVSVFNSVGQLLLSQQINGIENEIQKVFDRGVYFVKINNETTKVIIK